MYGYKLYFLLKHQSVDISSTDTVIILQRTAIRYHANLFQRDNTVHMVIIKLLI